MAIARDPFVARVYGSLRVILENDCKGVIDIFLSRELYLNKCIYVLLDIFESTKNMEVVLNFVLAAHGLAHHAFIYSP